MVRADHRRYCHQDLVLRKHRCLRSRLSLRAQQHQHSQLLRGTPCSTGHGGHRARRNLCRCGQTTEPLLEPALSRGPHGYHRPGAHVHDLRAVVEVVRVEVTGKGLHPTSFGSSIPAVPETLGSSASAKTGFHPPSGETSHGDQGLPRCGLEAPSAPPELDHDLHHNSGKPLRP